MPDKKHGGSQVQRREAAARALLLTCPTWNLALDTLGNPCLEIPGSRGKKYLVTKRRCSCPDANVIKSGREDGPCKHVLVARMFSEIGNIWKQLTDQLPGGNTP